MADCKQLDNQLLFKDTLIEKNTGQNTCTSGRLMNLVDNSAKCDYQKYL